MGEREQKSQLYEELIRITTDYLGLASKRFLDRQIENHFDKHPSEINNEDISKLTKWLQTSMSVLTNDKEMIQEYIQRISQIKNSYVAKG